MANQKYINALKKVIGIFKEDFFKYSREQFTGENGKLTHPGEFGGHREKICKQLFENFIPSSRSIETRGFIINAKDQLSTEQDLIFYSKPDTPILTVGTEKFFPIETVVGVGQVKSIIRNKDELKDALTKLSDVKRMRYNMGHDSVIWRGQDLWNGRNSYSTKNPYDQVFTFLVSEKIDFKISADELDNIYNDDIDPYLKHNIIVDLTNGIFIYKDKQRDPAIATPFTSKAFSSYFIRANEDDLHIQHLLTNLHIFITGGTVFHPDMSMYIK